MAGRVGLERIEEQQDAVQRAREHAEEQELYYAAAKHLLESLETAETTEHLIWVVVSRLRLRNGSSH